MHPAFSVIFLTTLIGIGQGLFLALLTGQFLFAGQSSVLRDEGFYVQGYGLALLFLVAGLGASFFHLGRPERAWRGLAQWRTSWLSREVLIMPVAMALMAASAFAHWAGWSQPGVGDSLAAVVETGAVLAILLLFLCTGMVYAGMRFLEEWSSWLTVVNFTLFGLSSGFLWATAFGVYAGAGVVGWFAGGAVVFTLLACASRWLHLRRNARLRHRSTVQTALGIRHSRIVQISQGATGGSFNTREFFHGGNEQTLLRLRGLFLLLICPAPLLVLALGIVTQAQWLFWSACVAQYLGLMIERWSFLAEARHPQNLYYQAVA